MTEALLIQLLIVAVLYWILPALLEMPATAKRFFNVVTLLVLLIILLGAFGIFSRF